MADCIHCGQDCGKNPVIWDEKPFCCNGCSMVYQILAEKKLDRYLESDERMAGLIASAMWEPRYYPYRHSAGH